MAGSFAQSNVARNDRLEHLIFEVAPHFMDHLVGEVVSAVKHGEEDPLDLQFWIEGLFDQADRFEKLSQPFHGIVFALERNKHRMGRGQGIDGEQAEGGGTIDEDIIVIGLDLFDQVV